MNGNVLDVEESAVTMAQESTTSVEESVTLAGERQLKSFSKFLRLASRTFSISEQLPNGQMIGRTVERCGRSISIDFNSITQDYRTIEKFGR